MDRRERNKQKKKKAREERLRQEKHLRQVLPREKERVRAEAGVPDFSEAPSDPESIPASPTAPSAGAEGPRYRPEGPLDNFFQGEPARKWLDALLAGTDTTPILDALEPAEYVPSELLLRVSVCCEVLVAAELVAAGIGRPSRHLPPRVLAWLVERDQLFSPGLVALAARAVRRVGDSSELRQLWDTVRLSQEWLRGVDALHGRLRGQRE